LARARRTQTVLLAGYKRLPQAARMFVVRRTTPSFSVGAICVVDRPDGRVLLVRQSYRGDGWGFPGGLLRRHEEPAAAARRELQEELNIEVELTGQPVVVVDPTMRRVDVIFNARLAPASPEPEDGPHSPEITDARWFAPDDLPRLLPEATAALVQLVRTYPPGSVGPRPGA